MVFSASTSNRCARIAMKTICNSSKIVSDRQSDYKLTFPFHDDFHSVSVSNCIRRLKNYRQCPLKQNEKWDHRVEKKQISSHPNHQYLSSN